MDQTKWTVIRELFESSLAIRPEKRTDHLDEVCPDPTIREAVIALLAADANDTFLPRDDDAKSDWLWIPETIGPYEILYPLGKGGMGVVYAARQSKPIERKVAIKVIRPGLDPQANLQRFDLERRSLARMQHPNIAPIYDAGTSSDGSPYFVMELLSGSHLTDYCDEHAHTVPERLELFLQVCDGVHHAHQKGIIHRDLKPSNIVVSEIDAKPVVKIFDFGIAKVTEETSDFPESTTRFGQVVGTPAYMSPEQIQGGMADIDVRSDVFCLGVLLYELLTGALPFSTEDRSGKKTGLPLLRPSARVSPKGPLGTGLARRLQGDLDWICIKALEEDREKRYESASALASDLRSHLKKDPVSVGPPSTSYRLKKLLRKHRLPVAAGSTIAALLILGTVFSGLGFVTAKEANQALRKEIALTSKILDLQPWIVRMANLASQGQDMLSRIEKRIKVEFGTDPEEEAMFRLSIGQAMTTMACFPEAEALLQKAWELHQNLGSDPSESAGVAASLGVLYGERGEWEKGEIWCRRALDSKRSLSPAEDPEKSRLRLTLGNMYLTTLKLDEAEFEIRGALAELVDTTGQDSLQTLFAESRLGLVLLKKGQLEESERLLAQCVSRIESLYGPDSDEFPRCLGSLGLLHFQKGDYPAAERSMIQALRLQTESHGERDLETVNMMNNLGDIWTRQKKLDKAEEILSKTLEIRTEILGEHHSLTLSINSLANVCGLKGNTELEEKYYHRAYLISRAHHGPSHRNTLVFLSNLGSAQLANNKLKDAERNLRKAVQIFQEHFEETDPAFVRSLGALGELLFHTDQFDEGVSILDRTVELRTRLFSPNHPETLLTVSHLAGLLFHKGDHQKAIDRAQGAIALSTPETRLPHMLLYVLGLSLERTERPEEAVVQLNKALQLSAESVGDPSDESTSIRVGIAKILIQMGEFEAAETVLDAASRDARALKLSDQIPSIRKLQRQIYANQEAAQAQGEP